ncbi:Hypothetical protein A7982_00096 [Minicystis rosea]|nr:Hypothetical protein A7982_00096 [Minicystis rosea]
MDRVGLLSALLGRLRSASRASCGPMAAPMRRRERAACLRKVAGWGLC